MSDHIEIFHLVGKQPSMIIYYTSINYTENNVTYIFEYKLDYIA